MSSRLAGASAAGSGNLASPLVRNGGATPAQGMLLFSRACQWSDVTAPKEIDKLVEGVGAALGKLDCFVHAVAFAPRDELKGTYGPQIACYTGNGGSRWDPDAQTWQKPKVSVWNLLNSCVKITWS